MPKHVPTRIGPLLAAAAALAASSPLAAQQDECRFEAERTASVVSDSEIDRWLVDVGAISQRLVAVHALLLDQEVRDGSGNR